MPHFLCVGAQKAGTTWLHHNLDRHPGIWMPPLKELQYFTDYRRAPVGASLLESSIRGRRARRELMVLARSCLAPRRRHLRWRARYLLRPRSDAWYASLFTPATGQIAGECAPGYCRVDDDMVRRIHGLMPDAKIIYLLRNPIERDLSNTAMRCRRLHGDISRVAPSVVESYVKASRSPQSEYVKNLRRWRACFPADRVFVGFFEQIGEDPAGLLRDVYTFLGVDASEQHFPGTLDRKRNAGGYAPFPDALNAFLARRYIEEITELHAQFDNTYTARWMDEARAFLGTD